MFSLSSNSIGAWLALAGLIVFGTVALYGLIDKTRRSRTQEDNTEADKASTNLVGILQKTVGELTKKVDIQTAQIQILEGKVDTLETVNKTLTDVLQGRDKAAIESQALVKDTHEIVKNMSDQVTKLATILEGFMKGISTTTINKIS